jgi:hypothetical protein
MKRTPSTPFLLLLAAGLLAPGLLFTGSMAAAQSPPVRKKLIATGWDSPTPAEFHKHISEFEKWPFDGTTIQPTRKLADGKIADAKFAFSREHWERAEFSEAIADLKAARPRSATDSFLMLYANPGDVDWFDDAGWKEVVEHWRILAWVAGEGGLRGILFDAEPYTPPHEQFKYSSQAGRDRHSFSEYAARARERGREVMSAALAEFPDITIFTYRLLCDLLPLLAGGGDPAPLLETHAYGLVPAFLDGWLDAIPPGATIIEGDENAYRYNSDAEFDRAYVDIKTRAIAFISPENRPRFRAQCQVSHGIYLDAHANPPTSPWYVDPLGGPRVLRLEANVAAALRAADEVVWIYGETARWWPSGNPKFPTWPEKLAGADLALLRAKDPLAAARRVLAEARPEDNLLRNPAFADRAPDGSPADWWFWKDDGSGGRHSRDGEVGAEGKGSARADGTENGCFGQSVKVRGGEVYAVSAKVLRRGRSFAGVTIRWKDAAGRWTAEARDVGLTPVAATHTQGWREFTGAVRVPDSAAELVVLLAAREQKTPDDAAWFDDARVVQMRAK